MSPRLSPTSAIVSVLALCGLVDMRSSGAFAQNPPPAGWTLTTAFAAGYTSNPLELTTRAKGDALFRPEIGLSYRKPLWDGAALTASLSGSAEHYLRESASGTNRAQASLALSQSYQGFTATLSVIQRKAMNADFSAHDSASREVALGVSRSFALAKNLTLTLFTRGARRYSETLLKDQWRAGSNATLAYKMNAITFRMGIGAGYALEDKTALLPRLRDQSFTLSAGAGWEWAKDRELAAGLVYTRTFSSLAENRTKIFSVVPKISATHRF